MSHKYTTYMLVLQYKIRRWSRHTSGRRGGWRQWLVSFVSTLVSLQLLTKLSVGGKQFPGGYSFFHCISFLKKSLIELYTFVLCW